MRQSNQPIEKVLWNIQCRLGNKGFVIVKTTKNYEWLDIYQSVEYVKAV